jgi:hypothetical protein
VFEVELAVLHHAAAQTRDCTRQSDMRAKHNIGHGLFAGNCWVRRTPTDADMALVDFTLFDAEKWRGSGKTRLGKIPLAMATPLFAEALKMMQADQPIVSACQSRMAQWARRNLAPTSLSR